MRQSIICNCHTSSNKSILKSGSNRTFCDKCGCVILKGPEGNVFYTLKAKNNRLPSELNPITIIKNMKKKTEEEFPFINEEYNINKADNYIIEKTLNSIDIYLRHRKMILLTLQNLMKTFDYSDTIFYQCLFYLDTYLSHHMTEDTSEKKLLYYLVGFFLISSKFREKDTFEPPLDTLCDLKKGVYLFTDKIAYYEMLCLKKINYNVFSYSAYDWITQLISNGIIFNCELNYDKEIILIKGHRHSVINAINKYALKLLLNLTSKNVFFKYSPAYLAFSLIQMAREKYLEKDLIKPKLFFDLVSIYGFIPGDYMKCYVEIKSELNLENDKNPKETEKRNLNNKDENDDYDELKTAERTQSTKKHLTKNMKENISHKFKSNNSLFLVNDNLISSNNSINEKGSKKGEKKVKFNLNESNRKKRNINKNQISNIQTIQHLAIDCNAKIFQSNDSLPYINPNPNSKERSLFMTLNEDKSDSDNNTKYHSLSKKNNRPNINDLKHVKANLKRFNSIEFRNNDDNLNAVSTPIGKEKRKENIKKKSKFFSNKNLDYNNNFEVEVTKKNKLTSKILPKITGYEEFKMDNNLDSDKSNKENKSKKRYKLKSIINNLEIKVSLPEEEDKTKKDSNKKIEVF